MPVHDAVRRVTDEEIEVVNAAVEYVRRGPQAPGAWTRLFDAVQAYRPAHDATAGGEK